MDNTQSPETDYTLVISKPDADGMVLITSPEVPGLCLYGDPAQILWDSRRAVEILDEANGRRRP